MSAYDMTAVLVKAKQFLGEVSPERYIIRDTRDQDVIVSVTVGRYLTNDIVVPQDDISNIHAKIERRKEIDEIFYYLIDKNSLNGTYINGLKVQGECRLKHGDHIALGEPNNEILEFHIPAKGSTPTKSKSINRPSRLNWDESLQIFWVDTKDNRLSLKPNEQRLLRYLYHNAGMICSREEISRIVWIKDKNIDVNHTTGSLNTLISELRKKLNDTKDKLEKYKFIRTVRDEGYILEINPESM